MEKFKKIGFILGAVVFALFVSFGLTADVPNYSPGFIQFVAWQMFGVPFKIMGIEYSFFSTLSWFVFLVTFIGLLRYKQIISLIQNVKNK